VIALLATLLLAPLYDVQLVPAGEDSVPVALAGSKVLGNSARGPWIWDGGASVRYLFPGESRQLIAMGFNERGDVVGYELSGKQKRAFVQGMARSLFRERSAPTSAWGSESPAEAGSPATRPRAEGSTIRSCTRTAACATSARSAATRP